MASQLTITAKTGPGLTVTAAVVPNITGINFDFVDTMITVFQDGKAIEYDIAAVQTITATVSSGNFTFTLS